MALTVNTNIASLTAQRNLTSSQNDLSTSLARLSSGLRINSAKDDAAGLAISERFTAQIRGLNQGVRNANDAISLSQTAEGALGEITSNLQRIRELAVQSANATNSSADRATLQAEVSQLVAEIDRVASATAFNGIKLLDGTFTAQTFQVGAGTSDTVTLSQITNARSTSLGADQIAAGGATAGGGTAFNEVYAAAGTAVASGMVGDTDLTITSNGTTTSAITYSAGADAAEVATAINSATAASSTGVTAKATNTAYIGNFANSVNGDTFALTLTTGGTTTNALAVSEVISDVGDLSSVVSAINAQSTTLGVTASQVTLATGVALKLETTDGRDIAVTNFGFGGDGDETASFGIDTAFTGGVTLTQGGNDSSRAAGQLTLTGSKGAITLNNASADFDVTSSSKTALSAVSLSTVSGATTALDVVDAALDRVTSARGDLGAYQSRFESVVANLQVASENLTAARSRIVDADFAAETASLTKAQILQQSGIAMLAQANAIPQNVLALLQ